MRAITYTASATVQLRTLPADVRKQIIAKLRRYAETGAGRVKPLAGRSGARLRVGDYRVIFLQTETEIIVAAVGHRRDVYR